MKPSDFQSHNGAIAAQSKVTQNRLMSFLSIPQWCDCCKRHWHLSLQWVCLSIPQWCDCCWGPPTYLPLASMPFNPTMVRLLLLPLNSHLECSASFNPTMVRLLRSGLSQLVRELRSFNPTMVRLLLRQNFGI